MLPLSRRRVHEGPQGDAWQAKALDANAAERLHELDWSWTGSTAFEDRPSVESSNVGDETMEVG